MLFKYIWAFVPIILSDVSGNASLQLKVVKPTAPDTQDQLNPEADKENSENLNANYAELILVDKITGESKHLFPKVRKNFSVQDIKINVKLCKMSGLLNKPESTAFLEIWECPKDLLPRKLFSGWMFASSPAISTLVNHSRYNIWLKKCFNRSEKKVTK